MQLQNKLHNFDFLGIEITDDAQELNICKTILENKNNAEIIDRYKAKKRLLTYKTIHNDFLEHLCSGSNEPFNAFENIKEISESYFTAIKLSAELCGYKIDFDSINYKSIAYYAISKQLLPKEVMQIFKNYNIEIYGKDKLFNFRNFKQMADDYIKNEIPKLKQTIQNLASDINILIIQHRKKSGYYLSSEQIGKRLEEWQQKQKQLTK